MPDKAPDPSKPYCLMNSDGSVADWFATHAEAVTAMRDTSKARYSYSENTRYAISPVRFADGADGDVTWIEALQARTYHTPQYGEVQVTVDKLNNFVSNFKSNVRGIEITTDYDHGKDAAKGNKASGVIKDVKVSGDKLLYGVSFTDTAKKEIKDGEWKYFSADWLDTYVHEDGSEHQDVLLGGGLTNRPVAKGLSSLPVNFSELYDESYSLAEDNEYYEMVEGAGFQFATLTYAQRKALPASSFLYTDAEGKHHLPVPDENHIRAAITRLSQKATGSIGGKSWLTESLRKRLLAKARAMLSRKQGGEMNELLKQLCESLGIQFSEDPEKEQELQDACLAKLAEVKPVLDLQTDVNTNKTFAEQYPEQYAQMQADKQFRQEFQSRTFAENVGSMRFKDSTTSKVDGEDKTVVIETSKGLSAKCLDAVKSAHLKFSEGNGTATDLEDVITAIFDNGIVDYGESGTSAGATQFTEGGNTTEGVKPSGGMQEVRKQFAEVVANVQLSEENKDKDYMECVKIAAQKNPELYEAYVSTSR